MRIPETNGQEHGQGFKTKSSYYTEAKVQHARANMAKYEWAARQREAAVQEADKVLRLGLDVLWNSVTSQQLPRSIRVGIEKGSPITGESFLREYGFYGWLADPFEAPWKLKDPSSGYVFPTNDFEAYYASALDESGNFDPGLGDPRYLVNELYPEKGAGWGVDDGFGWLDENGNKWTFAAYYNHWHVWYRGIVSQALNALRDAFLYTGELKYAQAGLVLLDRIADVYPAMDSSVHKWKDGYAHSHGGTGKGKIVGCIWEPVLAWEFLAAYDAFFPVVAEADVVGFLRKKAEAYRLGSPKTSPAAIRNHIEQGIVLQIFTAIQNAQIRGNFGMHQRTLAMAAIVLDHPPITGEWVSWILKTGGMVYDPELRLTGGNVLTTLVDEVDRDGHGNEASPGYNSIWLDQMKSVAEILDLYGAATEANLFEHVKVKKMFDTRYPLVMANRYTPTIGDTGKAGNPMIVGNVKEHLLAFEKYGDPVYAQFAYFLNGNRFEGLQGDIFSEDPERIATVVKNVIEYYGPLMPASTNLTGYGFTALMQGGGTREQPDPSTLRDCWIYYGRNTGHGHKDTLNLGIHAFDLDLTPDLGYPESTADWPKRWEWINNTVSHNTVVVDGSKQLNGWVGFPHHYEGNGKVQLIDVDAPGVYPNVDLYRRTAAFIQVDEVNSYAVDFFRVKGGHSHHYCFHAAEADVRTDGLKLQAQKQGTYAGEHIAFAYKAPDSTSATYSGDGFHYLANVERDETPAERFSVDWSIRDTWGVREADAAAVHLRLTMLGKYGEVVLADGEPPQIPGNPKSFKYMVAARTGDKLESQFVSVIEPYESERFIQAIESVELTVDGSAVADVNASAVKVVLSNGRTDYIVNSIQPDVVYTVDGKFIFQGFMGVCSEVDGVFTYAFLHDGTSIQDINHHAILQARAAIEGSVVAFTEGLQRDNEITVHMKLGQLELEQLVQTHIYVDNDQVRNAVYKIRNARRIGEDHYVLNIGDSTLIRRYKNPDDFAEGYIYDIQQGATFRIPLSFETEVSAVK